MHGPLSFEIHRLHARHANMGPFGLALLLSGGLAQPPSASWRPNFTPLGLYCYNDAHNPDLPDAHDHVGSCGCENTQFRWTDGQFYVMESHSHHVSIVSGKSLTRVCRVGNLERGAITFCCGWYGYA